MASTPEPHSFQFTRRLKAVSDRDVDALRANFLDLAEQFDASTLGDHTLFPLQMSWFYGEPIWHELPHEKQLMLNRLSFCQSYLTTAVAEIATNILNLQASLDTIVEDDPEIALYMAREVVEETMHVQAFLCLIRKIVAHYGLTLEQLRGANVSLPMASWYVRGHTLLGWLRAGKIVGLEEARKHYKTPCVCAVGMSPASESQTLRLRRENKVLGEDQLFYLQGGLDLARLKPPVRLVLKAIWSQSFDTLCPAEDRLDPAQFIAAHLEFVLSSARAAG